MKITDLNSIAPGKSLALSGSDTLNQPVTSPSFMDYLYNALGEVDELQKQAELSAEKLALGDLSYLHNAVIAYEKASLALELTAEVRNRIVEAYQEIMRMQM
ncbi:MAG: flagellar hook-basal body complex protein FliE [Syntrophomonadaceae bacterium]|jgi:flagellar hook-basal body complex protein FliE